MWEAKDVSDETQWLNSVAHAENVSWEALFSDDVEPIGWGLGAPRGLRPHRRPMPAERRWTCQSPYRVFVN